MTTPTKNTKHNMRCKNEQRKNNFGFSIAEKRNKEKRKNKSTIRNSITKTSKRRINRGARMNPLFIGLLVVVGFLAVSFAIHFLTQEPKGVEE